MLFCEDLEFPERCYCTKLINNIKYHEEITDLLGYWVVKASDFFKSLRSDERYSRTVCANSVNICCLEEPNCSLERAGDLVGSSCTFTLQ